MISIAYVLKSSYNINYMKKNIKNHENIKWLNLYLENCKQRNRSHHTLLNYKADIEKFLLWIDKYKQGISLDKITSNNVSEYSSFLENGANNFQQNLKENFQQKFLARFKKFSNLLLQIKHRQKNHHQALIPQETMPSIFASTPIGVNSRRRHISSIKNFYDFLKDYHQDVNKKFLHTPIRSKIHYIKVKDIDIESTPLLSSNDWQLIEEKTYDVEETLIIYLLYYGGLRIDELTNLKINNFMPEEKTLKLSRKGGSIHYQKIDSFDFIYNILQKHLNNFSMDTSEYLFPSSKRLGKPITTRAMYNKIMKIIKRGITDNKLKNISPHSFRKACATNLYKRTKDLLFVRDYMNHTDAKVTQMYIDLH